MTSGEVKAEGAKTWSGPMLKTPELKILLREKPVS